MVVVASDGSGAQMPFGSGDELLFLIECFILYLFIDLSCWSAYLIFSSVCLLCLVEGCASSVKLVILLKRCEVEDANFKKRLCHALLNYVGLLAPS